MKYDLSEINAEIEKERKKLERAFMVMTAIIVVCIFAGLTLFQNWIK